MSDRIDELMVQAGARFGFLHDVHYDNFCYRTFARLVIDECVRSSKAKRDRRMTHDTLECPMNEQIERLVGVAKIAAEDTSNRKIPVNDGLHAFAEKFAELIIKECILLIHLGVTRDEHQTEKYQRSMQHVADIKRHFGMSNERTD